MSEPQDETAGLARKNAELLAEVKELKAKVRELEGERDAALADSAAAQDRMRQITIETPLREALEKAFIAPWRVVKPLIDEHLTFELSEDGRAIAKDAEGKEIALDGVFDVLKAIPDIAVMISPPRGGGSSGSHDGERFIPTKPEPAKVASPFGLR